MEPRPTDKGFDTLFVRNMVEAALRIGLIFLLPMLGREIGLDLNIIWHVINFIVGG